MVTIHIAFVILTGLTVLYSDEQAFLWVLGKKATLSHRTVEVLHVIVSIGLASVIATGGLLFIQSPAYYLSDPVFITKMAFVGALVVNGFFIDRLSVGATERPFRDHSAHEKLPLLLSGAVSIIGWLGAAMCGLLLG